MAVVVLVILGLGACGEVTSPLDSGADECTTRTWIPVALANASFDTDGGWTIDPLTSSPICEPAIFGMSADSGYIAACFGAVNQADQALTQVVALPPGTAQVRLRGKRCLVTTEPDAVAYDTLVIELLDPNTLQTVAPLAGWSNVDAAPTCAWTGFELMAPVAGASESAMFSMHSVLDEVEVTTFFVDTLALDAFGC